jgi:hypothetical protein
MHIYKTNKGAPLLFCSHFLRGVQRIYDVRFDPFGLVNQLKTGVGDQRCRNFDSFGGLVVFEQGGNNSW